MYKKSLLSVAIASALTLTGCLDSSDPNNPKDQDNGTVIGEINEDGTSERETEVGSSSSESSRVYAVFNPAAFLSGETTALPIPNDILWDSTAADGTITDLGDSTPVTTALGKLSGASTVAPIDIRMSGEIDETTIANNVFLVALEYASGDPLQGLSAGEVPTILPTNQPSYQLEAKTLDGVSYVRINPTEPLNPLTRYLVVVTNGITDTEGKPISQNPGTTGYEWLTGDKALANAALAPIRTLINSFWEPTAESFFAASVNPVRESLSLPALTVDNIAMSYSFMTSGDEKVINYIADPAQWFNDQLTRFLGISAVKSVVANQSDLNGDDAINYTDFSLARDGAIATFPSADVQTALSGAGLSLAVVQSVPGCGSVTAGSAYISCLSAILGSPAGPFGALLPTPAATTVTFDDTETLDIYQVSSLPASLMQAASVAPGTVSVTPGTLTIPYYLGQPAGANGAPLITDSWVANDTLATAINSAFAPLGLQIPQADASVTDVVNYVFPFPKSTGDVEIPILAVHPTSPAGPMKTVMWQHGITTDRSTALTFGGSLVAGAKGLGTDVAVLAIDQPLHGIDGYSDADRAVLAESLLASASAITDDGTADGISAVPADQAAIDGIVAGTYSQTVVAAQLAGAGAIVTTDGISASEQALIDSAFTSTLATTLVTGSLNSSGVIDITDGIDAGEQALIDSAFDGTLASDVVTGQLNAFAVIDISNGIDAGEQLVIDAVLAGASGDPALADLEAAAASLLTLEATATGDSLPALESAAQSLALLERTVEFGSSQIPGLAAGSDSERHFGFTANPVSGAAPLAMDFEGTALANRSGSMFINFTSFLTSRDNLRQQVLDLLAVRKSIGSIDLNPSDADGADLDASDVYFIGHSLGTINGIPFVAVANDSATTSDDIVAANFLTPGGGISRFFENSPVFAPAIVNGLGALGLTPDTSSYQIFVNTLQATLDSIDPINFVADFTDTTPVLFTEALGDVFIPNSVDEQSEVLGEGSISFISGTEPLATISGATAISADSALTQNIVRFTEGGHETPVFPLSGTAEESAAYAEMVSQATSMVLTNGTGITVMNSDVVQ